MADTGVTTDSEGQVETWADQSGNGYDFSPLRAEARPGLTEDAAGGNPALTFDGEGQFLLRGDTPGIPDDSARTFVIVCKLDDIDVRSHFFFQGTLNASGADSNFYGVEANTYNTVGERFGVYLVSVANDSERETDSNYHIHTIRTESFPTLEDIRETTTYYVDGAETSFNHTGGGAFNSPFEADSTAVGANTKEDPSITHTGEIAAIRVYDSALSSADRESVESNLADTYGISLLYWVGVGTADHRLLIRDGSVSRVPIDATSDVLPDDDRYRLIRYEGFWWRRCARYVPCTDRPVCPFPADSRRGCASLLIG